jgi:hypothetical protein
MVAIEDMDELKSKLVQLTIVFQPLYDRSMEETASKGYITAKTLKIQGLEIFECLFCFMGP